MKTKRTSQTELILEALQQGRELTPLEALHEFGCFRLGARIWELRKAGYKIEPRIVHQYGKHFASYKLITVGRNSFRPSESKSPIINIEDDILELQDTIERLQTNV